VKPLLVTLACMAATLAGAEEKAIRKEMLVNAPVAEVWTAWTTSEGIQSFFAPEAFVDPRPDGRFHIHFNPYAPAGLKGADDMRVLAVQPRQLLSFTWNAPPHLPEARAQRTVVIVRLEPEGESRTRVRLVHLGFGTGGQWDDTFKYFDRAWGRVLDNLARRFTEGPIDWAPFLAKLKESQKR
jgi:uncharacterized protein YndB with AHSA1/START domain